VRSRLTRGAGTTSAKGAEAPVSAPIVAGYGTQGDAGQWQPWGTRMRRESSSRAAACYCRGVGGRVRHSRGLEQVAGVGEDGDRGRALEQGIRRPHTHGRGWQPRA
jgi:hypothetical protein